MRKLIYGRNLTVDGYVAAPGDVLGWSGPSDELFQWWLDQERAIGPLLYGRKLWEAMSSHWPTGDQQPNGTPAHGRPEQGVGCAQSAVCDGCSHLHRRLWRRLQLPELSHIFPSARVED